MNLRKKRVDEDWKIQAEREKERIAGDQAGSPGDGGEEGGAPPGATSLVPLFEQLGAQAMTGLGQIPDPRTGAPGVDLELARWAIDLLGSLEAKTRGRLSGDEDRMLQDLLLALRQGFVQVQQAVARAAQEPPPEQE